MAEKTGLIRRSIKNIYAPAITGAMETRDGLTMVADGISPHGTITKDTMIVIGRLTEPKDMLLGNITNIADRFISTGMAIIAAIT
jgi:hypothetical protein